MTIRVPVRSAGTYLRCYCKDCQTAARLHDRDEETLSACGGSDIWHTTPDLIDITTGAEALKISRLSPRGALRWYAGCCGTLMFSTLNNLKVPFISVALRQPEIRSATQVLGPVRCHAYTAGARAHPDAPGSDMGMRWVGSLALKRALVCWLSGRATKNPLRRPDGTAVAPVEVISLDAREAALPDHLRVHSGAPAASPTGPVVR